jgi:hypothetical protein
MRWGDQTLPLILVAIAIIIAGTLSYRVCQQFSREVERYELATPGVDDHIAYRLDKYNGEVCRIDFLEKATRCADAEAEVYVPYLESLVTEIPE